MVRDALLKEKGLMIFFRNCLFNSRWSKIKIKNYLFQSWVHGEVKASTGAAEGAENRDRGAESGGKGDRSGPATREQHTERGQQVLHSQTGIVLLYLVYIGGTACTPLSDR